MPIEMPEDGINRGFGELVLDARPARVYRNLLPPSVAAQTHVRGEVGNRAESCSRGLYTKLKRPKTLEPWHHTKIKPIV